MVKKSGFKYPRLSVLLLVIIITYFVFSIENLPFSTVITSIGIFGAFIAGFFYAFSFTAFAATALLLILGDSGNIWITGLVAGIGSLLADLLIFKTARVSFHKEFEYLYKEKFVKALIGIVPRKIRNFLKITIAMIIIASPLPDEAGVALLANGKPLSGGLFSVISYILNTVGILTILYAGKALI